MDEFSSGIICPFNMRRIFDYLVCLGVFQAILLLPHLVHCQQSPFDAREATIESVHHSLFNGLNSCREVVTAFLARTAALNYHVNAIISTNPNALAEADALDERLAAGNATGSLFCIPIFLKDNYDTADMNTTGGCFALTGSQPSTDAPSVAALRRAGAIILGKANLHELALEGLSVSSAGGQTINPYDYTRTPGGSSGGSGAAIASSFCVFATGTDTVNSLRSPASANSLFSIRPTRGLISRAGVIPISYTQDALGAIARTVKDVASALTVMASIGYDPNDNATALIPASSENIDYASNFTPFPLSMHRFGILTTLFNRTSSPQNDPVNIRIDTYIDRLRAAGATIIEITDPIYNSTTISNLYDVQRFEYRQDMNSYLQDPSLKGTHPQTLNDLYETNNTSGSGHGNGTFLVIPSQYSYVTTALISSTSNATYASVQAGIRNLTLHLQSTFSTYDIDALLYPEQQNLVVPIGSPSQSGRNGILGAITGSPVVCVPAGFSNATSTAPIGVPIGMEILGRPWSEQHLLNIARGMEYELGRVRRTPVWADVMVEASNITSMPVIVPDRGNIPAAYPIGVL